MSDHLSKSVIGIQDTPESLNAPSGAAQPAREALLKAEIWEAFKCGQAAMAGESQFNQQSEHVLKRIKFLFPPLPQSAGSLEQKEEWPTFNDSVRAEMKAKFGKEPKAGGESQPTSALQDAIEEMFHIVATEPAYPSATTEQIESLYEKTKEFKSQALIVAIRLAVEETKRSIIARFRASPKIPFVATGSEAEKGDAPAQAAEAIPQKRQPDDVPRAGRMSDEEILLNLVVSLLGDGVSKLTAIGNDAVSQYARRIKLARAAALPTNAEAQAPVSAEAMEWLQFKIAEYTRLDYPNQLRPAHEILAALQK